MSKKDKLIKSHNEIMIKVKEHEKLHTFRECKIPDMMCKDAFIALSVSLLQEFFMSGDTKYMIFQGMLSNLEKMGYSQKDMEKFRKAVNESFEKFHTANSFMG